MIEPTPGRVLWYWPKTEEVGEAGLTPDGNQPLAAHIAFVHSPTMVNVMIIDAKGRPHGRESVQLLQDGVIVSGELSWMPYQKGQAAKADDSGSKIAALEQQVVALTEQLANTTEGVDKQLQALADAQARKQPADPPPAPVSEPAKHEASALDALAPP